MPSICCILGAGYSHAAGVPLTRDLFAIRNLAISSEGAARRFQAVWDDYGAWLSQNPSRNAEEYLADVLRHSQSTVWTVSERYALRHSSLETTAAIEARQSPLPFPDHPVPTRKAPQFEWVVELLGAVLATPLPSDTTATNFRYGARVTFLLRCEAHAAFWHEVAERASHVAAITTNYDILVERELRPRRMRRTFGPGCYYGGIPKPQVLRGTQPPGRAYQDVEIVMEGAIPVYKLHGSLNWSLTAHGLELFQDLRPAFRHGGDAAIIPPIPEKEIPPWLRPVWNDAEDELAKAEAWIVCGYSLPLYDMAVIELLRRAATRGRLTRILVLDPQASDICCRYSAVVQGVQVIALEGLPDGINRLRELL